MFSISNNGIITMTRGDSVKVPVFINAGDSTEMVRYSLRNYDTLYFGIMEPNVPFEHSLVRKVFTKDDLNQYGDVEVKLGLDDTQYLQPGTYYYEVKIMIKPKEDEDGVVDTIVPRRKFFIVE